MFCGAERVYIGGVGRGDVVVDGVEFFVYVVYEDRYLVFDYVFSFGGFRYEYFVSFYYEVGNSFRLF